MSLVQDGSTIGIGGFGVSGHPMALLYQLVRQGTRELTLIGITNGNDVDLLAGAGCLRRLETAAVSLEEFGLAPNFRRGVEGGQLALGEYTESTMIDRLLAASMGLSFFPTRVLFGSDVPRVNPDIREVMCRKNHCRAALTVLLEEETADPFFGRQVESDRRLVQKYDLG